MYGIRSLIKTIVFLTMVGATSALYAQDGLGDAFLRLGRVRDFSAGLVGPTIATADFNNDTHPDGAVLFRSNNSFRIEVYFRFQRVSRITFDSKFSKLSISAFDVNHDGNPDLVVEEPFSHQRLFVWLNDGYGSFHSAHAEDYPNGYGDSYGASPALTENPQGHALSIPGKSRDRSTAAGINHLPAPVDSLRVGRESIVCLYEFSSALSLLRGPPSDTLL